MKFCTPLKTQDPKGHTLFTSVYPLRPNKGVPPPPPPPGAQSSGKMNWYQKFFHKEQWVYSAVVPRYNKGLRDWQNVFSIRRFRHIEVLFHTICYYWGKKDRSLQRAKKIIFTACKLKLAVTSPNVISASPKSFLTSRIDFTVLLLFEFLKKTSLARRAS